MTNSKISNIKLGLFVTVAFALFTIGIYNIGDRQFMFGSTFLISANFKSVKGLKVGNNVRYSGISVGTVEDLVLVNDSVIRVDLTIDNSVLDFIKKDAIASIATDGLVGNMIVNISPGRGDMPPVSDGDIIKSYSRVDTDDLLNTLGNTTENIQLLTANLLSITDNINSGKGSVAAIINDPMMARNLQLTIENLKATSQNVESVSGQFQKTMEDLRAGEGLLGYLMNDTTFKERVAMITGDLDTILNFKMVPIIENLQISSEHISQSTEELSAKVEDIDLDEGLAGVLLKDSLAAQDLREMIDNLNQGTNRFNESMEALQHNFLLRGFFKKQEKRRKKELEKAMKQEELKNSTSSLNEAVKS